MIRRFRDATVLLIVASNAYHVLNTAARYWLSRGGIKTLPADGARTTHGLKGLLQQEG